MVKAKEVLKSYAFDKQYQKDLTRDSLSSGQSDKNGKIINAKLQHVSKKIETIENSIISLKQPSKNILYYRYIKHFSYEQIARKLNYSVQRIYQLTKVALEDFEEEFNNQNKSANPRQ